MALLTADTITNAQIRALADEADFSPTFAGNRTRTLHVCAAALNEHGLASREYQQACRIDVADILNARAKASDTPYRPSKNAGAHKVRP